MEKLARSLAGHDKGCVYAVVSEEEGRIALADGKSRTLERPKYKNVRHVQMIIRLPDQIRRLLETAVRNEDVVHLLRQYGRSTDSKEKTLER